MEFDATLFSSYSPRRRRNSRSGGYRASHLEAARVEAIAGARSILSQEVLQGDLPLNERIDIENEQGEVLLSLSFMEAVHVRMNKQRARSQA
ncbi:MAG: hypothetical protein M3Q15_01140 [Pseudomonadota bacterium]|nr:hypothetical protein [Pseudomonadota bacterium]